MCWSPLPLPWFSSSSCAAVGSCCQLLQVLLSAGCSVLFRKAPAGVRETTHKHMRQIQGTVDAAAWLSWEGIVQPCLCRCRHGQCVGGLSAGRVKATDGQSCCCAAVPVAQLLWRPRSVPELPHLAAAYDTAAQGTIAQRLAAALGGAHGGASAASRAAGQGSRAGSALVSPTRWTHCRWWTRWQSDAGCLQWLAPQ